MPPMDPAKGTRLDSWKEIAEYLKCAERTAARWEVDRGMPVHRVPGGQRNAVFAYSSEIDAWLTSRSNSAATETSASGPLQLAAKFQASDEIQPNGRQPALARHSILPAILSNKWALFTVALCAIGVVWGIGASLVRSRASASVPTGGFIRLTNDGHHKLNLRTDGATLYFNEAKGGRQVLMATSTHGGSIRSISTPFSNVSIQDVSHDGRNLLVTSFEGIEYEQPLWVIPSTGGIPHRVGVATCHSASWSPDDNEIVCASRNTIELMDIDGANQRRLASFPTIPETFAWSPDGTRLRFLLSDPTATSESAWELTIDKSSSAPLHAPERLPLATDCCNQWGWTQDGKSFLYTSRASIDKNNEIVRTSGGSLSESSANRVEVPVGIGLAAAIAPGKNDHEIFVVIATSWRGELVKLDPKRDTLESFLPGMSACYISFSPDGKWISFVDSVDNSLWRSKADGTESLRLTLPPMDVELSAWSPDGEQIAFTGRKPGKPWRIYLVSKDGGVLREASAGDDNQGAPTWFPDGKSLAYANIECHDVRYCAVHRIALESGTVETMPGSLGFRTARWSPDGRYIVALKFESHELMLYEISTAQWKSLAGSVTGDDINWAHDSKSVYVDSPQSEKPIIERIRIKDGNRTTVGDLSMLQTMPGDASMWFGLGPDESLIVLHFVNGTEIYRLDEPDR